MQEIIPKEQRKVRSLSWSKVNAWLTYRKNFIATYFDGKPFFETKEIIFGSTLGNMIELGEYADEDRVVDKVMRDFYGEQVVDLRKEKIVRESFQNIIANQSFIEKLEGMAFDFGSEMEIKMDAFIDGVYLIGFADNGTSDWRVIKEFKTGKTPWTQEKVDEHGQLDFYCLLTYISKGYFPEDVELTWFETVDDGNGGVTVTGKIETFKYDVEKFKDRILSWEKKIPEIFEDIQRAQLEWEKQKANDEVANFDDNLLLQLSEIERQKSELDEKAKELKKQIEEDMEKNNLKDYKMEGVGTIFYTTRKKYKYPDNILELEKNLKDEKKIYEQSDSVEFEETESISFRLSK